MMVSAATVLPSGEQAAPEEAVVGDESAAGGRHRPFTPALLLQISWVFGLSGWYVLTLGRFGFNPTDQGWILAASRRLLEGQIPHRDIVSARPLGYAVLHVVDFALPGPLFIGSITFATLQLVMATMALAVVLTGRSPIRWGGLLTGMVAAASLVNIHTFPATAWHTIDGIFLTACGWWLLDVGLGADRAWCRRSGLFLLGFAAFTKQSFALVPLTGLVVLLAHPAVRDQVVERGRVWWARTAVDLACLGAFPVAYLGVVTAAGGLDDMVGQLSGAGPAWFGRLFDVWEDPTTNPGLVPLVVAAGVLILLIPARARLGQVYDWIAAVAALAVAIATVQALVDGHLALGSNYAVVLLWGLLTLSLADGVRRRRFPARPLAVALLAWMSALSWGYDTPGLVGGSMALGILWLLLPYLPLQRLEGLVPPPARLVAAAAAGLVVLGLAGQFLTAERHEGPYRDQPQDQLVASLGEVASPMRGIRSSPAMLTYLQQLRDCVEEHPASRVAVLPDSGFVYPALGLDNPFPIDWSWPDELVGEVEDRMLETAAELNDEGDYLVLFQTFGAASLPGYTGGLGSEVPTDAPIYSYTDLEPAIRDALDGRLVSCGSFVGVWDP